MALQEAQKTDKPVVAYFFYPISLSEDRLVWQNPLVVRTSEPFIGAFLDIEKHADLIKKYDIHTFPAILFFDSKGRELLSLRMEEEKLQRTRLASRMKRALESIEEFNLIESQLKKYQDNPKIIAYYAKGLRDRGLFDQAEAQYNRLLNWKGIDPKLLEGVRKDYVDMFFFKGTLDLYAGNYARCIQTMERFLKQYPGKDAEPQAQLLIGMAKYESGDRKEGERLLNQVAKNSSAPIYQERARQYLQEKKGITSTPKRRR